MAQLLLKSGVIIHPVLYVMSGVMAHISTLLIQQAAFEPTHSTALLLRKLMSIIHPVMPLMSGVMAHISTLLMMQVA